MVINGTFRLDLMNIGVTKMEGLEFYGRDDLLFKFQSTLRDDMILP
jgi:hypothetical protein